MTVKNCVIATWLALGKIAGHAPTSAILNEASTLNYELLINQLILYS